MSAYDPQRHCACATEPRQEEAVSAYNPQRHCACATEPRQKLVRRLAQSLCGTVSAAQHANRAHGGGGSALRPQWAQLQRLPRAPAFARQRK